MVEKLGHKKRIQLMRMEWINEGKPKATEPEDDLYGEPQIAPRDDAKQRDSTTRIAPIFEKQAAERLQTPAAQPEDEDLYSATPAASRTTQKPVDSLFGGGEVDSIFGQANTAKPAEDEPPEDDLDALLAEEEMFAATAPSKPSAAHKTVADDFADDEEAMAEMDGMW
jgi:replication fork protection complex subunit Csm3/Swi3